MGTCAGMRACMSMHDRAPRCLTTIAKKLFGKSGAQALQAAIPWPPHSRTLLAKDNDLPEDVLAALYDEVGASAQLQHLKLT